MKEHKLEYYYDEQLRKLLIQFLAVFSCIRVSSGKTNEMEERLINVSVKNGSSDRVVAAIKGNNTQNTPIRLPLIAGTLTNLTLDASLRKGNKTERTHTYMEAGATFPEGLKTVEMVMPVPYMGNFEVNVYASSQEQHYEILEQILMLFDPTLELQTSDDVMDWTRLHKLELTNISFDEAIAGVDRRVIQTTLSFDAPVYLSAPAIVRKNYIGEIQMRVGAVSQLDSIDDALSEMNQNSVEYEVLRSIKGLDFDLDS